MFPVIRFYHTQHDVGHRHLANMRVPENGWPVFSSSVPPWSSRPYCVSVVLQVTAIILFLDEQEDDPDVSDDQAQRIQGVTGITDLHSDGRRCMR